MGLCKCRVVTTLFCFQHRVNVCENCLVKDHDRCVVKTYLAWLQDSDFDASCKLCHSGLDGKQEVVRLLCHDLFHVDCLDKYCRANFPPNTAPAGFQCPSCKTAVVPPAPNTSPIACQVRDKLAGCSWASLKTTEAERIEVPPATPQTPQQRPPLYTSTPLQAHHTDEPASSPTGGNIRNHQQTDLASAHHHSASNISTSTTLTTNTVNSVVTGSVSSTSSLQKTRTIVPTGPTPSAILGDGGIVSRKANTPSQHTAVSMADADDADNKYTRRPANAWFARLVGNRIPVKKAPESAGLKRTGMLLLLLVLAFITVIEMLTRVQPMGTNDPLLNPAMNPNLRTSAE
eukprot:m.234443 g.234443  ORF g.234443 m.234443 type:complete len:345 (-) comp22473_c1_seq6:1222-2256(-)